MSDFVVGCCFCDRIIPEDDIYVLTLNYPDETDQEWFCHRNCFRAALHPDYRYFDDEELDEARFPSIHLRAKRPISLGEVYENVLEKPMRPNGQTWAMDKYGVWSNPKPDEELDEAKLPSAGITCEHPSSKYQNKRSDEVVYEIALDKTRTSFLTNREREDEITVAILGHTE